MLSAFLALVLRVLSNPVANAVQKLLVQKHSAILINLYSYLILSLCCLPKFYCYNWAHYDANYWLYVMFAGLLCTMGSVFLIKALQIGEMSVLGPINSYKCIVGLVFGFILLGEVPSLLGVFGICLILFGSRYIFDTENQGFTFKLLLRKDIIYRFCALLCTGCEAVVLKKIILLSSVTESFILWCFSGFVFSLVLLLLFRKKFYLFSFNNLVKVAIIALCLGIMQYTTNIVFKYYDVGLSLALFQLSSIVAIFLGYKMFDETYLVKKLIGALIMILGSSFILLT